MEERQFPGDYFAADIDRRFVKFYHPLPYTTSSQAIVSCPLYNCGKLFLSTNHPSAIRSLDRHLKGAHNAYLTVLHKCSICLETLPLRYSTHGCFTDLPLTVVTDLPGFNRPCPHCTHFFPNGKALQNHILSKHVLGPRRAEAAAVLPEARTRAHSQHPVPPPAQSPPAPPPQALDPVEVDPIPQSAEPQAGPSHEQTAALPIGNPLRPGSTEGPDVIGGTDIEHLPLDARISLRSRIPRLIIDRCTVPAQTGSHIEDRPTSQLAITPENRDSPNSQQQETAEP